MRIVVNVLVQVIPHEAESLVRTVLNVVEDKNFFIHEFYVNSKFELIKQFLRKTRSEINKKRRQNMLFR